MAQPYSLQAQRRPPARARCHSNDVTLTSNAPGAKPLDRVSSGRPASSGNVVRVEIGSDTSVPEMSFSASVTSVGALSIAAWRSTAATSYHGGHGDKTPRLSVGLQATGVSTITQGRWSAVLNTGDLYLLDPSLPFRSVATGTSSQHVFTIDLDCLASTDGEVRARPPLRLDGDAPDVFVAASHLGHIANLVPDLDTEGLAAMGQNCVNLISTLVFAPLEDFQASREPVETALQLRIMEYVRAHLRDPDLTAARIAFAHHISVRHLYSVLALAGISLGDWVRHHRLEECRRELAQPEAVTVTITTLSRRWGFGDATHFGRVFKDQYGMSPRAWRELHQPARITVGAHARVDAGG